MTFAASLDEPLLAELYRYWSDCRGERFAPARGDIDPVDIPHLLPHVALSEVGGGGRRLRFRYRLAGTQIEERFGCPLTNRYLDELKHGQYLDYIVALYERIIAEQVPIYSKNSFSDGDQNTLWAKHLMLPLSEDGIEVTMVLAGIVYVDSHPSHRTTVLSAQNQFYPSTTEAR